MVKLNKKRIKWLVNQVINHAKKQKDLAPVYKITERRVQQLVKEYKETKKYPDTTQSPKRANLYILVLISYLTRGVFLVSSIKKKEGDVP